MLILLGVHSLALQIVKEQQLAFLLRTTHFETIDLSRQAVMDKLLQLTFTYAQMAGIDFSLLAKKDFLERLFCACCNRWGLVIEMLIEAFRH